MLGLLCQNNKKLAEPEIKYNSYSVIGAARSGVAAAKLLKSKGYKVFLSDASGEDKINKDFIKEIHDNMIEHEFGRHSGKVFENELIVVSPGVPQDADVIQKALSLGKEVISEIEVASWFCKGKIISITGTNGKTTTTALTGKIFEDAGFDTHICGNIGVAFSDVADKVKDNGVAVVETSSFQLDNIKYFKPFVSVLMNITPDHLDRYEKSFQKYTDSKLRVFENQDEKDYFVFNYDDKEIQRSIKGKVTAKMVPFSLKEDVSKHYKMGAYLDGSRVIYFYDQGKESVIDTGRLIIKGPHNVYNSLASIISARIFGIDKVSIERTLTEFKGVEHRVEFVRELNGVRFYNDSKATNVNSVWYALQGFTEPIVLILGGKDKGNDYSEIENEVKKYVKHIIAIGSSKDKVYDFFKNIVPVTKANDFEEAVRQAYTDAEKNNVVLLSPACASFDMFENYEHRGKEFKRIVNELK
jgi:UDP-N-acetylmuramoylalanine--D-glutamate ligase